MDRRRYKWAILDDENVYDRHARKNGTGHWELENGIQMKCRGYGEMDGSQTVELKETLVLSVRDANNWHTH